MILDKILARKKQEVAQARRQIPLLEMQQKAASAGSLRGFAATLRQASAKGTAIIAEIKKGSPSKGIIRPDFDPVRIACDYAAGGAACLSVLTDRDFFFGDIGYLKRVRGAVALPLLRKDFIIDPYQVFEARACGADAILLIAAALPESSLKDLAGCASELGMDVLFEVHDKAELAMALRLPVDLIGINNRNLRTFETDLGITERLAPLVPADRLVVAESGISGRAEIVRLQKSGTRAFLIGESLMRESDIRAKLAELLHD
jgi:indole-3-glycerol phosphate synthase